MRRVQQIHLEAINDKVSCKNLISDPLEDNLAMADKMLLSPYNKRLPDNSKSQPPGEMHATSKISRG